MSLGAAFGNYASAFRNGVATSYVTKVTPVAITIPSGATSATASVSTFDTTRSFLIWGNTQVSATGNGATRRARIEVTDATTITAYRNTSSTNAVTVYATLVECSSDFVDSVQQGTVTISASTSGTQSITAVDLSRSEVFFLGNTTAQTGNTGGTTAGVYLSSSSVVAATVGISSAYVIGFVVVQFKSAVIKSIQRFGTSYTTTNTVDTQTISVVDPDACMIAYGGFSQSASIAGNGMYGISITSSTNVNLTRALTDAGARVTYYSIIEFQAGVLKTAAQRGNISMLNINTNSASLFPSLGAKGIASFVGSSIAYTSTDASIIQMCIYLGNSSTVVTQRGTSNGLAANAYYQALDFN